MGHSFDLNELGSILNSLSSYNRLYTYLKLYQGENPAQIADHLEVTRNALQHYLEDWKQLNLIYTEGNDYIFTEKGEYIAQQIQYLSDYASS